MIIFARLARRAQLIFLVSILISTSFTLAAPTGKGNVTTKTFGDSTFASEPHGRGSVGVLLSCTATFIFCIWTAVHPNVVPGVKSSQRLYYKAVLMVISILIPEALVVSAIGEFREARRLLKDWNECTRIPLEHKSQMDMRVAFFVVMGGFIVDERLDPEPGAGSTPKPGRLTMTVRYLSRHIFRRKEKMKAPQQNPYRARLTPTGFRKYMERGLIDHTSFRKADIVDKGKASAIGKSFAGIQALWLVVQSISRAGAKLPLSLLEIHVLIHVGRTALIYWYWWDKPLDVNEPIRIFLHDKATPDDQEAKVDVEAPKLQGNHAGSHGHDSGIYQVLNDEQRSFSPVSQHDHDSTLGSLRSSPVSKLPSASETPVPLVSSFTTSPMADETGHTPVPHDSQFQSGMDRSIPRKLVSEMSRDEIHKDPLHGRLRGKDRLKLEILRCKTYKIDGKEPKIITSKSPQNSNIILLYKAIYDIIIHLDVSTLEEREERPLSRNMNHSAEELQRLGQPRPEHAVDQRGADKGSTRTPMAVPIPDHDSPPPTAKHPLQRFSFVMFSEMFLVCLTGALHALAWNKYFPTPIERWLWRGSSLTMCACALWIFIIANFSQYERDLVATMWKLHLDTDSTDGFFKSLKKWVKELHHICIGHARKGDTKKIGKLRYLKHLCGMGAIILFVTIYFLSVSYITVESYIALRKSPYAMWLTVSWIDYWPHL